MSNRSGHIGGANAAHNHIAIRRGDIWEIVRHFCGEQDENFTAANGLEAFHHAVCTAFARIDLPAEHRGRINDFINALQDLYETIADQDQNADAFFVESEDLQDISANLDCMRLVICIQHSELHHHDVSSALLWAKTALRTLIRNDWNAGFATRCSLA